MNRWKQYQRTNIAEMRAYEPGESMEGISVSSADQKLGSPKVGDMIARNPLMHADQWLVSQAYAAANFAKVRETTRTRKVTMTVFCLEEDVEQVKESLINTDGSCDSWFFGSDCPLTTIKVEVSEPTAEEDRDACDNLEVPYIARDK